MNFNEAFIKKRLQWRSNAFLVYLRNTIHIARKHTMGLAKSAIKNTVKESKNLRHIFQKPGKDDALWAINLSQ